MPKAGELVRVSDYSRLDYVQEAADSATITTSETVVATLTFTAVNGGVYATSWNLKIGQSVGTDYHIFGVREDSVTGTILDQWGFSLGTAAYGGMVSFFIDWTASASGAKTIVGTLIRGTGTGNVQRMSKSNYQIYRVA